MGLKDVFKHLGDQGEFEMCTESWLKSLCFAWNCDKVEMEQGSEHTADNSCSAWRTVVKDRPQRADVMHQLFYSHQNGGNEHGFVVSTEYKDTLGGNSCSSCLYFWHCNPRMPANTSWGWGIQFPAPGRSIAVYWCCRRTIYKKDRKLKHGQCIKLFFLQESGYESKLVIRVVLKAWNYFIKDGCNLSDGSRHKIRREFVTSIEAVSMCR